MGFAQLRRICNVLRDVKSHSTDLRFAQHAADARVGVLYVVDGIVAGVGLRQVQIEIQMLLTAAHDIEVARGVVTDIRAQLTQSDELATASRHLHLLAATIERDELHD